MKATMIEKALNAEDWLNRIENYDIESVEVQIEKTIELSQSEFKNFSNNFIINSEIIKNNQEKMFIDKDGIWHCIKITAANMSYSILVESEGYDYARHTGIIID